MGWGGLFKEMAASKVFGNFLKESWQGLNILMDPYT